MKLRKTKKLKEFLNKKLMAMLPINELDVVIDHLEYYELIRFYKTFLLTKKYILNKQIVLITKGNSDEDFIRGVRVVNTEDPTINIKSRMNKLGLTFNDSEYIKVYDYYFKGKDDAEYWKKILSREKRDKQLEEVLK